MRRLEFGLLQGGLELQDVVRDAEDGLFNLMLPLRRLRACVLQLAQIIEEVGGLFDGPTVLGFGTLYARSASADGK